MKMCCSVCQMTDRPNEYDVDRQSEEESPLVHDGRANCQMTSCIWKFRIIASLLTALCFIMIAYLIYLQSVLGTLPRRAVDHGAVATDNVNCSKIGIDALEDGGNAVDAAIAAVLCMTVVAPYKTGLGGGGIAMVYNGKEEEDPLIVDFATNTVSAGILASAKIRVPSVIRGLEFLHDLKGSLPWSRVVQPAEKLAKDGFLITKRFSEEVSKVADHSMLFGYLRPGERLVIPHLGDTLEAIKNHGSRILYNGSLALKFLRDEFHEIHDDLRLQLANYEPIEKKGKKLHFYDYVIYTPEHSELFHATLKRIEHLNIPEKEASSMESQFKVARALLETVDEDENLEREVYTAVIAADSKNNFVSIVTGLSGPFGLRHMTGAGCLLDTTTTNNNLHLLTPVIFHSTDSPGDYSGVLGLDDPVLGTEILANLFFQHHNISTAIETQRYYRLLNGILLEPRGKFPLDEALASDISTFHHLFTDISRYSKSVNGVINEKGSLFSHSDSRGGGVASRYK